MGDYRSVMYRPEEKNFLYSMGYEYDSAQAHWGPCRRNYCILHYVTRGKGYFCGREVRRGEGFYIHADQLHEYHADEQDGWNYFWMTLSEGLAKEYVLPNVRMNEHGIFRADFASRLQAERQRIFAEKKPLGHMEALSVFFSVMSLHEESAPPAVSVPMAHLNGAKVLIDGSFGRRLTVREVAREICIDDRYLYNLFMQHEGISPKAYIDRQTVNNACSLLTGTGLSVTEIAARLGFDDVCAFSRFFRKKTGMSPTDCRRKAE